MLGTPEVAALPAAYTVRHTEHELVARSHTALPYGNRTFSPSLVVEPPWGLGF